MKNDEFPEIQRGNGVGNDNLATLADIMKASLKRMSNLENKIGEIEIESLPRQKNSYVLLIISVVISLASILIQITK